MTDQTFTPDYNRPPGTTIRDLIEDRKMSATQLSELTGLSQETVEQLLTGNVLLTDDIATRLETALGVSASFWVRREAMYRERLMTRAEQSSDAEDEPTAVSR